MNLRSHKTRRRAGNSLNLKVLTSHGTRDHRDHIQDSTRENQNILLGRLEQNKYVTERDTELEAIKQDEGNRRKRLEKVNY